MKAISKFSLDTADFGKNSYSNINLNTFKAKTIRRKLNLESDEENAGKMKPFATDGERFLAFLFVLLPVTSGKITKFHFEAYM